MDRHEKNFEELRRHVIAHDRDSERYKQMIEDLTQEKKEK
jgi:hypothetical protein